MPTIHVSNDLMKEIEAYQRSDSEPPTQVLERMLEMDRDAIEQIVEDKVINMVIEDALTNNMQGGRY